MHDPTEPKNIKNQSSLSALENKPETEGAAANAVCTELELELDSWTSSGANVDSSMSSITPQVKSSTSYLCGMRKVLNE